MALAFVEWTITPDQVGRLDQVVHAMTGRSRSEARAMLERGLVQLNKSVTKKPGLKIEAGAVISVTHDPHTRYKELKPERQPRNFRVLFEDEHLIVVNKFAGVLTVQTDFGGEETLVNSVTDYLKWKNKHAKATAVHRLDRDTSGALVLAKTPQIAHALMEQFKVRKADREYVVLVAGHVTRKEGTFKSYMATSKRLQRYSVRGGEQGELAITHFKFREYLDGATYLTAILETGRRNQIRVHFSESGHPVLGDDRYRPREAKHPGWKSKGLGLHAEVLGFVHPVTGEQLRVSAPLPKDIERFLKRHSLKKPETKRRPKRDQRDS